MNTEITSSIHYVGVNDRHKHIFEGLWPLPYGVSYNSYIIDDEKVALIDTVEVDFFPQFLANMALSSTTTSTIAPHTKTT